MRSLLTGLSLLILFSISPQNSLVAQEAKDSEIDVIHLKDGNTISGKILERIPEKTVVIDTKDGIEMIDYVNIRRIEKEYVPSIGLFSPDSGEVGTTFAILGTFPSKQPPSTSVFIGSQKADIVQWKKNEIVVRVPNLIPQSYPVTVQLGNQKDESTVLFKVRSKVGQQQLGRRIEPQQTQEIIEEPGYNLGGFWLNFSYAKPTQSFGSTDISDSTAGFANPGFNFGYEGRIKLSDNFYLPVNFQYTLMGFNLDELNRQVGGGGTFSANGEFHQVGWFTLGLGFAINLSKSAYLFGSAEFGGVMAGLPNLKYESSGGGFSTSSEPVFTTGFGYSFGLTFPSAFTMGMKVFSTKPKYSVTTSYDSFFIPSETHEFEQPTNLVLYYIAFNLSN